MKFIEDINVDNKKVILRLDLNVTIKDNQILDDTKISKSLKTINYLLDHNCKVLIMSHLGKIKTEEDKANNSLKIVCAGLCELLGKPIVFVTATRGKELEDAFNNNNIVMMENTRYEDLDGKKESGNDEELAKYWASLGEVFINDAFGTTHRCHASNNGISKYLESGYGYLIKEELDGLDPIVNNIKRPFTVIMGGAKVDDKVQLIKSLLNECDNLLVGGGIANTFLKASGYEIGESLYSADYIDEVKDILNEYSFKIVLPIDVVVNNNDNISTIDSKSVTEGAIYDLGPKTLQVYRDILDESETVFINGTIGLYEDERYNKGTIELFNILRRCNNIKIAGGGDAVASINTLGYQDAFNYLSTGGGATLEYIADKKLKCFEE
ncbi:MAG: phosphoglycerate kinase [Bacilli bacterium]|nr:phosphoglycerate kinase [Bacilli bacterium]